MGNLGKECGRKKKRYLGEFSSNLCQGLCVCVCVGGGGGGGGGVGVLCGVG